MRTHKIILGAILVVGLGAETVLAQTDLPIEQAASDLAASSGEIHLGLYSGEQRDGFMRLGWYREDDDLIVYDRSLLASQEVYETFSARMSAEDLSPEAINLTFNSGSAFMEIKAKFEDGKASGTRRVVQPGMRDDSAPIDVDMPDAAIFRAMSFIVPLVLPQTVGETFSYQWFAPMSQQAPIAQVTLSVEEGGMIETGSTSVETVRYALRGSAPENDIYVTRGDDPEIVRIDVLGTDLKFLALED